MTNQVRLAIVGSGGQVGRQLVVAARSAGIDVRPVQRQTEDQMLQADLLDPGSVERALRAAAPTHVILAAAATNVAWCEAEPTAASAVNVQGARAVATVASRIGAKLLFISTDYVFDGTAGPYDEHAVPNPINQYGRQKLAAEQAVSEASDGNLVVRTCQVFGPDPRRRNYVLHVADALRAGRTVRAAVDLFGTPTFAPDLASSLIALCLSSASGVWHVAGGTYVSRHELASRVAVAFRVDSARIVGVPFVEITDGVPRPRRSGLTSIRVADPPLAMTSLDDALEGLASMEAAS